MASNPPDNRYRRRFLVEFTAAESDLADRLGAVHGSKRRAIVQGLSLLESGEVESLRAQVSTLEQERDAAKTAASKASESLKTAKAQAAGAKEAANELTMERAAHNKTKAELTQARRDLALTQQTLAEAQADAQHYASVLPTMAYCPSCEKYVPSSEWAEQPVEGGIVHVYHAKHGYQPKETFTKSRSVMLWWGESK
jgi:hypothetical protein